MFTQVVDHEEPEAVAQLPTSLPENSLQIWFAQDTLFFDLLEAPPEVDEAPHQYFVLHQTATGLERHMAIHETDAFEIYNELEGLTNLF